MKDIKRRIKSKKITKTIITTILVTQFTTFHFSILNIPFIATSRHGAINEPKVGIVFFIFFFLGDVDILDQGDLC